MSNERRIYKYQGTLIGDDRVDSIDIDKLNTITPYLSYNSDSSSFEIGSNLYVNGELYVDTGLIISGNPNNKGSSIDISSSEAIYLNGTDTYNNYIEFILDGTIQTALTNKNTKTLFGNSLYGSGNIDLYKHYLHIQGGASGAGLYDFYIVIQSSSNVDCSSTDGATQKLKTLLKVSGSTPRIYETGVCGPVKLPEETENYDAERPCALYWDESSLYVRNGVLDFTITLIEDKVETL